MNKLEIIRNGLMQCIEKIEALLKRMSNAEATMKKQEVKINEQEVKINEQEVKINEVNNEGKIPLSVMENFAISQFANFTYLYYEENGEIKSKVFNDGNVSQPQISSYVISGKPLSYRCWTETKKVEFKNFDTSSVTNMHFMFGNCEGFRSLDVSKFNTSAVTDMSYMFEGCRFITLLDVSKFNTSAVTDMSYMFRGCRDIKSLDLSNFDTSAVTNMAAMFSTCTGLKSLDLSNFDTSAVTNMASMFNGCTNLTSLDLSNFDTSAVTNMAAMFNGCTNLTSIIGTHTLEEVQAGTIKAMRGHKWGISFSDSPNLERASILALFYGLAEFTGGTHIVTLHATAKARLTAEDIKIATGKKWIVQ